MWRRIVGTNFRRFYQKEAAPPYADVPKPKKSSSERKPYVTPMKTLIERAKAEKAARRLNPCRVLPDPPDNGLLVPELVPVAHRVHRARLSLLRRLSRLASLVPVLACSVCRELHVGPLGHRIKTCSGGSEHSWRKGKPSEVIFFPKSFHLFDRAARPRVTHDDRWSHPRIPAIVELCIQAGVDLPAFPATRRTKPVYSMDGRIVDFEQPTTNQGQERHEEGEEIEEEEDMDILIDDGDHGAELANRTVGSWVAMIEGAAEMMKRYMVWTCGYCEEVMVGPKGHKVRKCRGSKHQNRDGLHAWQEAAIEDLVGPNYVWHVRDSPLLHNCLKRYYGKAPAVIELCVQAGAHIPDQYRSMMRLDVVPPDRDEADLVA